MSVRSGFSAQDSERSFGSLASSFSGKSFITGKSAKLELKRKFYENLSDFKSKVVLHKEPGFVVYRARCSFSGGVVVLKGYSRETLTLQTRQRICTEVGTLQKSQCPFILKCFDSFEDQGWWWLVLENCAAGDLYHIVQENGPIWEEGWLVSQVLLPLLQTLIYLHAEGIIHRDVKPEHVLFNSEKVAKLSGFFLAQDVNRYGLPKDMVGTLDYVAPEVFKVTSPEAQTQIKAGKQSGTYDYKVDVWMLGVLIYDVLVGRPPFNQETPNLTVEHILLQDPEFPDEVSDMAADFVLNCLTKDPAERPTAAQLLAHPWVRENLAWTPPEDFDDIVPDFDIEYYHSALRDDNEDASDSDSDDGIQMKWYNPMTWHILKPKGTEGFKGEGLRGGISMSVVSFAKKLVNMGDKEEQDEVDYLEKKDFKGMEGPDDEKPAQVGSVLKLHNNKVAPEKFVKGVPSEDDDEDAEDSKGEGQVGRGSGEEGACEVGDQGKGSDQANGDDHGKGDDFGKGGAPGGAQGDMGNAGDQGKRDASGGAHTQPEMNGVRVTPLKRVTEEEVREGDRVRAGPWLNEESGSKEGAGQEQGKQDGEGAEERNAGGGGSFGLAGAAALNGDLYGAFMKRLSSATAREEEEGGTGMGDIGGGPKATEATSGTRSVVGRRGAAPDVPGNAAAKDATRSAADVNAPLGGSGSESGAAGLASGSGNGGSGAAQRSSGQGKGSVLGTEGATQGSGGALVGRAAEVAGTADVVHKASPRGQVLPSLGAASPRGHLPPFAQGAAPQPPTLPPGTSPRFAAPPAGSPRSSTISTIPSARASQLLPVKNGLPTSMNNAQAQLAHPNLSNMVMPFAEGSRVSQQLSEQVPSPSESASGPSGPTASPTRASPKVPKLALGALASQQQQQQQQQQIVQEPQPQEGESLAEGLLPWGNMDHSLRPQSRMAEDLVMESARGKDKAGVSRSTTNENLASLPKPQRVITSQQQQQQQQQPQETYGKGSGAASGVGSVMGWGFQLPLDGEGSQEHVSSPFEAPDPQAAPSRSTGHNGSSTHPKHSGTTTTTTTPAMPTLLESPAVSGALPGGVSLSNSRRLHNSGRLYNSTGQLLTVGPGSSNLGSTGHGSSSNLASAATGQPDRRACSTAQLRLGELAALPRPSSIARHTPPPGLHEPPMPLPPSSRYAASPPATAPVPSRSSTARLMSPLLPPQHPQSGAAGAPKTAGSPAPHTLWGSGLKGRPGTTGEGPMVGASPSGVRTSSALQDGGVFGSGASGDSAWSAAGRGAWNSKGSSANSNTAMSGAVDPRGAWSPASNDQERASGYVHNSNVDSAEARLNEVHALLGPSAPNTARDASGADSSNNQRSPAMSSGAQGWL